MSNDKSAENSVELPVLADGKESILSDKDFEKHGFKVSQKTEIGAFYQKKIGDNELELTYSFRRNCVNLIIVNRSGIMEAYGGHQFRDFVIKSPAELDFMLERCCMYQRIIS